MTNPSPQFLVDELESDAVVLSYDAAKEIFGVSDRNGSDSADAYTIAADMDTRTAWAPVFRDQPDLEAQVRDRGQPLTGSAMQYYRDPDILLVRMSRYTQAQVEAAMKYMAEVPVDGYVVYWHFDPGADAIIATGNALGQELFGSGVLGVSVNYEVAEAGLAD